jgi:hypothetical protein
MTHLPSYAKMDELDVTEVYQLTAGTVRTNLTTDAEMNGLRVELSTTVYEEQMGATWLRNSCPAAVITRAAG